MHNQKPIYILGSGAIGIALAVNLLENDRKVVLVRIRQDDLSETEITVSMKNIEEKIITLPVTTISLNKLANIKGLIVITTKAYVNENLV